MSGTVSDFILERLSEWDMIAFTDFLAMASTG